MSMPVPELPVADEIEATVVPDDGVGPLDRRAVFRTLLKVSTVRNYAIAALGALAMMTMVLFEQGSDVGGLAIAVLGLCGVLFLWPGSPPLILLVLTYCLWSPLLIPGEGTFSDQYLIWYRRFHFMDVFLGLSVVVYMVSQFRLFSLLAQAFPPDGPPSRKGNSLIRRPGSLIRPTELGIMLGLSAGLVIGGQIVWWAMTAVEIGADGTIPLTPVDTRRLADHFMPLWASRTAILIGLLFFGTLLARLGFDYWRLRMMGRDEARMTLLDIGWHETSRERSRLEIWRAWARRRRR